MEVAAHEPGYVVPSIDIPAYSRIFVASNRHFLPAHGRWLDPPCTKQYFGEPPIRTIDFTKPDEREMRDDLVALIKKI